MVIAANEAAADKDAEVNDVVKSLPNFLRSLEALHIYLVPILAVGKSYISIVLASRTLLVAYCLLWSRELPRTLL